ncbi:MAG: type II toxin-antitoxin system Phd/YefM family antitoxin [Planctomycetota bacterium]
MSVSGTGSIPLSVVASQLPEVVNGMAAGEELILTTDGVPVAVVKRLQPKTWPSVPGSAKDRAMWMAPDFDAPLDDFADHMKP